MSGGAVSGLSGGRLGPYIQKLRDEGRKMFDCWEHISVEVRVRFGVRGGGYGFGSGCAWGWDNWGYGVDAGVGFIITTVGYAFLNL